MSELLLDRTQMPSVTLIDHAGENPNIRSRVNIYTNWPEETGRAMQIPDLAAWRDDLEISARSKEAYISTVRKTYRRLLKSDTYRDMAY